MTPVDRARTQIGVLWRHQGRKPGKHLDCIGLLSFAFAPWGIQDRHNYNQSPHHGLLETELDAQFGPAIQSGAINMDLLKENDVVAFAWPHVIRHVGLIAGYQFGGGGLSIIHTNQSVGMVTEQRLDRPWPRVIKRVYRLGEFA